ncbi:alpha-N-acetylglucosaminidase [Hysterangium stoloniferum]|nr:alpha-N-acetylglucosaminidase [Hysterangium stoloniferum]
MRGGTSFCSIFPLFLSPTNITGSLDGIHALLKQCIPSHANSFKFELVDSDNDSFILANSKSKHTSQPQPIDTKCTSVSACTCGLYMYLTELGNVDIHWTGSHLDQLLKHLVRKHNSIVPYMYYFNTVTFSYMTAFYDFDQCWGGTLPQQWVNDQFTLQKQLVKRMVELGMTPVLPVFTGFVPCGITNLCPNFKVINGSAWSDLFEQMQKSFIKKQISGCGNVSHIYTLDKYNENNPASGDLDYLRILRAADPQATMMIQAWLFFSDSAFWNLDYISAYLGGPEDEKGLLILDLYTEAQPQWQRTLSYFGRPWVWCALNDYGGNQGFEGYLKNVTAAPIEAFNSPNSSMSGFDRPYRISKLPVAVQRAWSILSNTLYNNTDPNTQATVKSILELTPALPTYSSKEHSALGFRSSDMTSLISGDNCWPIVFSRHIKTLLLFIKRMAPPPMQSRQRQPLLTILCDLDTFLWMNDNFLLSNWIKAARGWGAISNESQYVDYLEYNARNKIALWGPDGEINDYASKQWAGIVGTYYLPRWTMFTTYLKNTTQTAQSFDSQVINAQLLAFGKQWDSQMWGQRNGETWVERGDTWKTVEKVLADYA